MGLAHLDRHVAWDQRGALKWPYRQATTTFLIYITVYKKVRYKQNDYRISV